MELPRLPDGRVTRLAVARSVRGVTCLILSNRVGVTSVDITAWERGIAPIPSLAMCKRLGLALGWPWEDLMLEPLDHESAWNRLVSARQRAVLG